MPRWKEHHKNNPRVIGSKLKPTVYDKTTDIPNWEQLSKEIKILIRKNWKDQSRVNQFIITGLVDNEIYLRNLDGKREILSAYGFQCIKHLGEGKDGKTFFGHRYLSPEKTCVVKTFSNYARDYIQLQYQLQEICRETTCPSSLNSFKIDTNNKFMWYYTEEPYLQIDGNDKIWYNALRDVCKLNSILCKEHNLLFWDFGFTNGKNYMIDKKNEMKWVDYGGAGIVRKKPYDTTRLLKNPKTKRMEVILENTRERKECLVEAYDTFLKIAFFLHLQYWTDVHDKTLNNIGAWMSFAQVNKSVADEIFYEILPMKLKAIWIKEMFELFKGHDFTNWVTWKKMGKYIDSHVTNT